MVSKLIKKDNYIYPNIKRYEPALKEEKLMEAYKRLELEKFESISSSASEDENAPEPAERMDISSPGSS